MMLVGESFDEYAQVSSFLILLLLLIGAERGEAIKVGGTFILKSPTPAYGTFFAYCSSSVRVSYLVTSYLTY